MAALDLNKLIADAKARDAEAKKRLEEADKSSSITKKGAKAIAESRRYRDYAYQLMDSRKNYESVIKRYASKIARGDKLDTLEQDELDTAVDQYNRLDAAITKAQQQAYNLYTGRKTSPEPITKKVDTQTTQPTSTVEMPMGAGVVDTTVVTEEKPKKKPSGKKPKTPTPDVATQTSFDAGSFRAAEEATNFAPGATPNIPLGMDTFEKAQQMYGGIDEIFKTDADLKALLNRAVTEKWNEARFINELENTKWFKSNAGPIRQRGFYKRQYDTLVNNLKKDDPNYQAKIDELNKTSEYGRGLQNAIETVTEEWTSQYGTPTSEDITTIKAIAEELYQYANENDAVKTRNFVLAKPKRFSVTNILGGSAGTNLAELRSVAAANGFNLEKDFGTSIQTWLDRIAKGESIETIKSIIRSSAKDAWKVNDRISNLLDQGVDLSTIYSPYKTRMAAYLEIAPETITFADLAAKGVVGGANEKNLYDFEKELRRDPRWQYTKNAREEMSSTALTLLRNFGFQG